MVHGRLVETHHAAKLPHLSITFDYPNVPQENFTVNYDELFKKALGHGYSHLKASPGLAPSPSVRQVSAFIGFTAGAVHTHGKDPRTAGYSTRSHIREE